MRFLRSALLACLFLTLSACAGVNPTVVLEDRGGRNLFTVTLSEADLVAALRTISFSADPAPFRGVTVNLRDGVVTLRGQLRNTANGRYEPTIVAARLGVAAGWPTLQVLSARFGNLTLSENDLTNANTSIAQGLVEAQGRDTSGIIFEEVTADGALRLRFSLPREGGLLGTLRLTTTDEAYRFSLNMSVADLQAALAPIFLSGGQPWLLNAQVVPGAGTLTVSGDVRQQSGELLPVRLALSLDVTDGQWVLAIVSLRLGGFEVPVDWLRAVNQGLGDGLRQAGRRDGFGLQRLNITAEGVYWEVVVARER
jgi:hypothetical protein